MLRKKIPILYLLGLSLLLASCGITGRMSKERGEKENSIVENKERIKAGKPIESGRASWYGPKFHGRLTANGEKYDMYGLTAAHRTLPFNTVVRVENLGNGKSVVVRVNDRGPFAKNRIIDLSKKAADEIGMLGPGTAEVRLFVVEGNIENSKTKNLKVASYTIQLGSFQNEQRAFELSRKIRGSRVEKRRLSNRTIYRVFFGTYIDKNEAEAKKQELARKGHDGYVKQIENE